MDFALGTHVATSILPGFPSALAKTIPGTGRNLIGAMLLKSLDYYRELEQSGSKTKTVREGMRRLRRAKENKGGLTILINSMALPPSVNWSYHIALFYESDMAHWVDDFYVMEEAHDLSTPQNFFHLNDLVKDMSATSPSYPSNAATAAASSVPTSVPIAPS